jgi:hypothetical protein
VFWVISVYFNIRNTLPKYGTFLLGHPVYLTSCVKYSTNKVAPLLERMGQNIFPVTFYQYGIYQKAKGDSKW